MTIREVWDEVVVLVSNSLIEEIILLNYFEQCHFYDYPCYDLIDPDRNQVLNVKIHLAEQSAEERLKQSLKEDRLNYLLCQIGAKL